MLDGGDTSLRRKRRCLSRARTGTVSCLRTTRRYIKRLVEHKYFQQGILLAILFNTLSMGIEYHQQVSCRALRSLLRLYTYFQQPGFIILFPECFCHAVWREMCVQLAPG